MKTLLATILTTMFGIIALPQQAEARPHCSNNSYTYVSGYTSCGNPIYTKRVVAGYDCYNRPIYRYYQLPIARRNKSHYKSPRNYNHYYRGYNNRHYRNHYYRNGYRRSLSFNTRYGNVRICR